MFASPFDESIIKRALDKALISICLHNIRDFTTDRHHVCDDTPYAGGGGMTMKPEPIFRAVETVLTRESGWALAEGDAYVNLPAWDAEVPAHLCQPMCRLSCFRRREGNSANRLRSN
jgi:tRNA (guanine37-N1)-methyltransferase